MRPALLPLVVTVSLSASTASLSETVRRVVIFQDKPSGSLTTKTEKDKIDVVFTYRDNGRRPDIYETIRLAPDGTIAEYRVNGKSTFGAPIAESFKLKGSRARWQSHSDRGETTVAKPAQVTEGGTE